MFPFTFFKRNRPRFATLNYVAEKLNLSKERIVGILQQAGFIIIDTPFTLLNEHHLEVLANEYVNSIKIYYNSISKRRHSLTHFEERQFRNFFVNFIKPTNFFSFLSYEETKEKVFIAKLDTELIKDFFFDLITDPIFEGPMEFSSFEKRERVVHLFNKFRHKIKLKLKTKRAFNDMRIRLHSILACSHYHIFSGDEDHIRESHYNRSFSNVKNIIGEALNKIYNLKPKPEWKTLNLL